MSWLSPAVGFDPSGSTGRKGERGETLTSLRERERERNSGEDRIEVLILVMVDV